MAQLSGLVVGVAAIVGASSFLAGCMVGSPSDGISATSSSPTGPTARTTASPSAAETVTIGPEASCPDVSGATMATSGLLRAGPFFDEGPAGGGERKMWVASDRPGEDAARLTVTDPEGRSSTQVRESGVAFIETAAQFYPGTVPVTAPGKYKIDITVRQDRMCVTVRYGESQPDGT